ncbi:Phenoloxidase-activating factor 3 [Chionoecetes opilio]|uniref:Phenoloxidase-activating factor 3 n=1 Tax=Chionoecetes opilio TaxID=41210 RepID=A0A8J5D444_CHIOP|nr:Phenoloxidase-activating factor 3 [Chionoecetes opilio]
MPAACGQPYGRNGEPPSRRRVSRQIIFPDERNYNFYFNLVMGRAKPDTRDNQKPPTKDASEEERFCSASPISEHFLVTAAHCVFDETRPVSAITLGDIDLATDNERNSRPADYEIEVIFAHPEYDPDSQVRYNDIALLRTRLPIQFNEVVFPYCVSDSPLAPGTVVTASGFGLYNATSQPDHLLEANFTVLAQAGVRGHLPARGPRGFAQNQVPENAEGKRKSSVGIDDVSDACQGDSGGPMYLRKGGKQYLGGIVSGGASCRGNFKSVLPGLYLSLAKHIDFINDSIFPPRI